MRLLLKKRENRERVWSLLTADERKRARAPPRSVLRQESSTKGRASELEALKKGCAGRIKWEGGTPHEAHELKSAVKHEFLGE